MDLLKVLKALAHLNRIRIINLLNYKELCVCELENILELNQSNVSRHLSKLKETNLIMGEKKAQWIYYRINEKVLNEHKFLKKLIEEDIKNHSVCKEDNKRLAKYNKSDVSCSELNDNKIFKSNTLN
ncbi:MAG TPA: metalloregulator ArsR/SmtB family transcription factor [Halanaerobiales bacterium]|nr:metalloregulator ArsR/SmtB family transcription factor [Halanaerobiales bacterium]